MQLDKYFMHNVGKTTLKDPNRVIKTITNANNLILTSIEPLSNNIIHSNPIYIGRTEGEPGKIYIKLYKSEDILKREVGCNNYLKYQKILVPEIISYGSQPIPHMITREISGKQPSEVEIKKRINDLAVVHANSLINGTEELREFLSKKTRSDRLIALNNNKQILQKYLNLTIEENQIIEKLSVILSKEEPTAWDNCFCFNDFFVNNSLMSSKGIYYYDFEKACIGLPFLDVGCIILNFPKAHQNIKSAYIKRIRQIIDDRKFTTNPDYIDYMIDLSTCEKALEDAAFLADDSIKKTKDSDYCMKLAKNDLFNLTKIFNNLSENN